MWTCTKCGEEIEDAFDSCWKCAAPTVEPAPPPVKMEIAWLSILGSYCLLILSFVVSIRSGFHIVWIVALLSALWAAFDSDRLQVRRYYKSDILYEPVTVFAACAGFWSLGFPWYLTLRHNIKTGRVRRIGHSTIHTK